MEVVIAIIIALLASITVLGQDAQAQTIQQMDLSTQEQHPTVSTEEYIELMGVVARLAGNTIFADDYAPEYQADIEKYFADSKDHDAILWLKKNYARYGIGYEAIPWVGAHAVFEDGQFSLIPNCDPNYKRWSKKALKEFLPLLSAFYTETDFHSFYAEHNAAYSEAVDVFKKNISDRIDASWFKDCFGRYADEEAVIDNSDDYALSIVICLNNGAGSFGIQRRKPGMKRELMSIMLYATDAEGHPIYKSDGQEPMILVHEFCHSFINAPKSLKKVGSKLLKEHSAKLASVGYGTWENVIEETFVRASVIKYMVDHGFSEEAIRKEIRDQHEYYGFVWLPEDPEWYRGNIFRLF